MSSAFRTIFSIVVFLQQLLMCHCVLHLFEQAAVEIKNIARKSFVISFHTGVLLKNNIADEFFITGFALEFHFLLSQSMDGG